MAMKIKKSKGRISLSDTYHLRLGVKGENWKGIRKGVKVFTDNILIFKV